jgi:hypothetical protein
MVAPSMGATVAPCSGLYAPKLWGSGEPVDVLDRSAFERGGPDEREW